MTNHTSTPWKVVPENYTDCGCKYLSIESVENMDVVVGESGVSQDDARYIVSCVNSRQRLIDALRDVTENLEHARFMVPDGGVSSMLFDSTQQARAILQELEGEL